MNSLGADLTDRVVIIESAVFPHKSEQERVFAVHGGFGRRPELMGRAIFGEFIHNGDKCRLDGHDVERFATDEDIAEALKLKAQVSG